MRATPRAVKGDGVLNRTEARIGPIDPRLPTRRIASVFRSAWAWGMLAPYVICLTLFFLVPFFAAVVISFTRWQIIGQPVFIGVANYLRAAQDPAVRQAVGNTFYYVALQTSTLILLGLGLALLLNAPVPGRYLARTVVVMPYVISVSVMGILWRWMYDPNFGIINYYLGRLGLPRLWWLTDPVQAMPSIVIADWWWIASFTAVVYLAGLQGISRELYEAADVDGATGWNKFWHVTLPGLRPVTLYVLILNTITSFQMFGESFVMTQGGPLGATTTLTYKLYSAGFFDLQLGYAAALSVVFLVAVVALTALEFRVLRIAAD